VLRSILEHGGATLVLVEHRVDEVLPLIDRVIVLEPGGGIAADGDPLSVFREHGTALDEAGVWVPGHRISPPPRRQRPPAETLVLAEGAGFAYPGSVAPALAHAEAQVRSSEALAITGPNGTGKTTLALLLGGLLRPDAGVVVAGEALAPGHGHDPIWRWTPERLVAAIGSVFQEPEHQFLAGTTLAELSIGPRRIGLSDAEARSRAVELLERMRLDHLAEANPFTLSGGEKRRLSVATALATAPSALILDEPTFGQDRRTWSEMLDLLAGLRDTGRAVCFVSHDHDFVNALADRTLRLSPPTLGA